MARKNADSADGGGPGFDFMDADTLGLLAGDNSFGSGLGFGTAVSPTRGGHALLPKALHGDASPGGSLPRPNVQEDIGATAPVWPTGLGSIPPDAPFLSSLYSAATSLEPYLSLTSATSTTTSSTTSSESEPRSSSVSSTSIVATPTTTPTNPHTSEDHDDFHLKIKLAIAFPVSFVGAAMLVALFFFLLKRRRRRGISRIPETTTSHAEETSILPGETPMGQVTSSGAGSDPNQDAVARGFAPGEEGPGLEVNFGNTSQQQPISQLIPPAGFDFGFEENRTPLAESISNALGWNDSTDGILRPGYESPRDDVSVITGVAVDAPRHDRDSHLDNNLSVSFRDEDRGSMMHNTISR